MDPNLDPPAADVHAAVERALAEDLTPLGDLTSALLPAGREVEARFVARETGVLAGRACATETLRQVDSGIEATWEAGDGDAVEPGHRLCTVRGRLRSVVVAERTALNFLGHLSGIATEVRRYVDAAEGARIWDTRKTTPGLRSLEKAAVRAGGGRNHRGNLSDWVMFKDNHLAGISIADAVAAARDRWPARTVEVECDRIDQLEKALDAGADLVLLDNMSPDQVRDCVAVAEAWASSSGRRPLLEASGGITLQTVSAYASTGVDLISIGRLTNSAPVLDIGLDIADGPP